MGETNVQLLREGDGDDRLSPQEIMAWIGDVERDRFVKFQSVFESDGWPLIVELATARAYAAGLEGANATTWEQNRIAYGARSVWEQIARLAENCTADFELVASEAKAAAESLAGLDDLDAQ